MNANKIRKNLNKLYSNTTGKAFTFYTRQTKDETILKHDDPVDIEITDPSDLDKILDCEDSDDGQTYKYELNVYPLTEELLDKLLEPFAETNTLENVTYMKICQEYNNYTSYWLLDLLEEFK